MRYRLTGLALDPHIVEDPRQLADVLARILGLMPTEVVDAVVIKHSLDARRRPARHIWSLECDVADGAEVRSRPPRGANVRALAEGSSTSEPPSGDAPVSAPAGQTLPPAFRPIVIGAGPAGLFACLALARLGAKPLLLERGQPVDRRTKDVEAYWEDGTLDPESNVLFGEGGAGTFSDGKIYTRSRNPAVAGVLKELVDLGVPSRILIEARPHIGADRLRRLLLSLRGQLTDLGVEIRFGACVTDLLRDGDQVTGVVLADGEEIRRGPVMMAAGQSARDAFAMMQRAGVPMEPWSSAIGVRIEHSQAFIDRAQYKVAHARVRGLPPADYHLAWHGRRSRGSYTFCMCPGGRIIGASNIEGQVVTNGMALSDRGGQWANSALVVQVRPEDYAPYGKVDDPLIGFHFQDTWEKRAAELGGGGFKAPAQWVNDFLDGRPSERPVETTYKPGTTPSDLRKCLPEAVSGALGEALMAFGRRLRGFDGSEGRLIGVETRTSCPVRIQRDEECRAWGLKGFYPVGEGAGYAGGIVSAAVDGLRAAEWMVKHASTHVAGD
jgi:uncharacterized protein